MLKAAVGIEQRGSQFVFTAQGRHMIAGHQYQSSNIRQLCVNGNTITVDTAQFHGNVNIVADGLQYQGFTFELVDQRTYADFVTQIHLLNDYLDSLQ